MPDQKNNWTMVPPTEFLGTESKMHLYRLSRKINGCEVEIFTASKDLALTLATMTDDQYSGVFLDLLIAGPDRTVVLLQRYINTPTRAWLASATSTTSNDSDALRSPLQIHISPLN